MSNAKFNRLFKKLTHTNWREPDDTARHIVRVKPDGSTEKLTDDDWASMILGPELSPEVPEEVRYLFEVAQGVLCYGCFFYPLYTLGSEQLYRVQEAALRHKCKQLKAPKKMRTFGGLIKWMHDEGRFTDERLNQWDACRWLRNSASHAERQSIYGPDMAVSNIGMATELINELFEEPCDSK